jgi:hypothetical protein
MSFDPFHPHRVSAAEDSTLTARVVSEHPLPGVASAFALLAIGERLLVIHDDACHISWIDRSSSEATALVLTARGDLPPQAAKRNFECAVYFEHSESVYLLGSGSTEADCRVACIELASGIVTFADRPELYRYVQEALGLATWPRIEGGTLDGGRLVLFHRGTSGKPSGRVLMLASALSDGKVGHVYVPPTVVELGSLDGVPLGITAAAAGPHEYMVFLANAGDVGDGRVARSVVGVLEPQRARFARLVGADGTPYACKVEGIVVDERLGGAWALMASDGAARPMTLCRIEFGGFDRLTPEARVYRELGDRGLIASCDSWSEKMRSSADEEHLVAKATALALRTEAKNAKAWIQRLPTLDRLRALWIKSRASQALFDAACELVAIEKLHVEWSAVERCDALEQLAALTHLYFGNSPRLKSLTPLARLSRLRALALQGIFRNVAKLDALAECGSLRGLALVGQDYKEQRYESLAPLVDVPELIYLRLAGIRIADGKWRPLLKLRKLEYLDIFAGDLKRWPLRAYRELNDALPRLENDTIRLAATDAEFQNRHGIR